MSCERLSPYSLIANPSGGACNHGGPRIVGAVSSSGCCSGKSQGHKDAVVAALRGLPGYDHTDLVRLDNGLAQVTVFFRARNRHDACGRWPSLERFLEQYARSFGVRDGTQVGVYWVGPERVEPKQRGRGNFFC